MQLQYWGATSLSLFVLALSLSTLSNPLFATDTTSASRDEANLRAVTFIDPDRGWAVGERGTILHTQDGGISWNSQRSPTTATLTDLAMYNSQRGLAIGGSYQPYTQISIGEVIVTKDGGQSWQPVNGQELPRLRKMIIGPGGKCVAVGDWSPVHLTSVFASNDGGQTWQPQACGIIGQITHIAGTIDDFLVLSDRGEVVRFRFDTPPQTIFPASTKQPSEYHLRLLAGVGEQRLLIGAQGAISSTDNGDTWQPISQNTEAPLSLGASESSTAVMWKDDVWAVKDASSTIEINRDRASGGAICPGEAALRGLTRLDDDRGWAVGDFGLIVATRDAGKTWRVLRGGNRSPAVMVVGTRAESLPWSLLALESLQHQRRVALVVDREHEPVTIEQQEQLTDALSTIGPSSTFVNEANQNRIADILRISRPAVVILDQSLSPSQRSAWSAAALEAGVKRVLEVGEHGSQTVHSSAAITALGILAGDVWMDAIARLSPGSLPPTKRMLSARHDTTNDPLGGEGLASCTRSDARYGWSRETNASRRQLQVLQARIAETSWIESLVASSSNAAEFKSQIGSVLPRMVGEDRERMFARLATLTSRTGRREVYVASLETIVNQPASREVSQLHKSTDLYALARLRLDAIMSSVEWRQTFGIATITTPDAREIEPGNSAMPPVELAVQLSPFQTPSQGSGIQQAGGFFQTGELGSGNVQVAGGQTKSRGSGRKKNEPTALAAGLTKSNIDDVRPEASADGSRDNDTQLDLRWEFHPAVLMVRQAAEHKTNHQSLNQPPSESMDSSPDSSKLSSTAATNLQRLAGLASAGSWGTLAANKRHRGVIRCPQATTQPYLDGSFAEPWWQAGQAFAMKTESATIRMAHDNDFVYIAIDAPALNSTMHSAEVRQRDTPLDASDRYRIRLDIDRDLMTAYEFEFDRAGNTRDSCDGFAAYNPRWFIACTQSEGRTRAELAIQKSDLSAEVIETGTNWNISIDRLNKAQPIRGLTMPDPNDWCRALLE